jgi:hypothetical protein
MNRRISGTLPGTGTDASSEGRDEISGIQPADHLPLGKGHRELIPLVTEAEQEQLLLPLTRPLEPAQTEEVVITVYDEDTSDWIATDRVTTIRLHD